MYKQTHEETKELIKKETQKTNKGNLVKTKRKGILPDVTSFAKEVSLFTQAVLVVNTAPGFRVSRQCCVSAAACFEF